MEKFVLHSKIRDLGTHADKLRKQGMIPAELYGHGVQNIHLMLEFGPFMKVLKKAGRNSIVELEIEGNGTHSVLIHDIQQHYLKSHPIHADFLEVRMSEKVKADVALHFVGEAMAVKGMGGTLVKVMNQVTIECLPGDLVHELAVDISKLQSFEDTLFVSDVVLPKGVVVLDDPHEVIAKVQPPRDIEKELAEPIVEDISKVEGAVKPDAPAEEKPTKK